MAYVAVAVDGDPGDIEDGTDDAEAHEEATDLAVDVACNPATMEDRSQDQWVWVDGNHQVSKGQAHHEGISCQEKE